MKITLTILSLMMAALPATAQTLSLDSCKARALRSNKQMSQARTKQRIAENVRKAARTKYLPHLDVNGGYLYSSRTISLLSDEQKQRLSNAGTNTAAGAGERIGNSLGNVSTTMSNAITQMAQQGTISPQMAQTLGGLTQQFGQQFRQAGQEMAQELAAVGNAIGQHVVDALNTNTHHMFTASAIVTQPIYVGGAITAGNKVADITEKMASTNVNATEEDVLYDVENAYWTVVSLKHKQRLATQYLELVQKLDSDVHKMIKNGVATRADGLKVSVAVNEADMTKAKVDNGLALAKMLLCQLCSMPLDSNVTLEDEDRENLAVQPVGDYNTEHALNNRLELKMLADGVDLSRQQQRIVRAASLPQVAMMTGAVFTNPSVYNSFERKFKGVFNLGVIVRVPVFDWGENMYAVRAAKYATTMAELKLSEAQEMVELQVNQCTFKVRESNKNLATARKNIEKAEENLRCANLGFREGVMQTTDVMAAQTAWMQAQTQKIDAEIDVKLSETALKKALGEM